MPTPTERGRAAGPRARGAGPLVLAALLAGGCGPPQVEPDHRELVLRLATATSTRDSALLEAAATEVERLRSEDEAGVGELAEFEAIVRLARDDDWEAARRRAYALRDAQRPTEADRERVRARTLPEIKDPGSSGRPR